MTPQGGPPRTRAVSRTPRVGPPKSGTIENLQDPRPGRSSRKTAHVFLESPLACPKKPKQPRTERTNFINFNNHFKNHFKNHFNNFQQSCQTIAEYENHERPFCQTQHHVYGCRFRPGKPACGRTPICRARRYGRHLFCSRQQECAHTLGRRHVRRCASNFPERACKHFCARLRRHVRGHGHRYLHQHGTRAPEQGNSRQGKARRRNFRKEQYCQGIVRPRRRNLVRHPRAGEERIFSAGFSAGP